ncbi:hypothetical protein IV454_20865 [Massilia antarctica]|uniref:Uncharacterized protein n=1 Tax=Massilia antarctica TaxID=2765360 RepID=A0AA48W880_9BURK|nr:hypothetical protein [Massilia antarctica]QPI48000.1 hypothetical protein IV454_20865 [Massilia antarctica]
MFQFFKRPLAPAPAQHDPVEDEPMDAELAAYFARITQRRLFHADALEQTLLDAHQSAAETKLMRLHPIIRQLGGVVLDQSESSNYYLYLKQAPFRGNIFYLSHDGDSCLAFASLDAFLAAVDSAKPAGGTIEDFYPPCAPLCQDQALLSRMIGHLLDHDNDDDATVVVCIIPAMDLLDDALLERMAIHMDMFISQQVALEIEKRPTAALHRIAALCSWHVHPQAARAGERALAAVVALKESNDPCSSGSPRIR